MEDADEDRQQNQLPQKGTSCCCRFVGKDLRAGPVDKVIVAQVKIEEGWVKGSWCLLQEEKHGKCRNQPSMTMHVSKASQSWDQIQLLSLLPLWQDILQPQASVDSGKQERAGREEQHGHAAKVGGDQAGEVVTCDRAKAQARLGCREPLQPGRGLSGGKVAQIRESEDKDCEGAAAQPVQKAGQVEAEEWQAGVGWIFQHLTVVCLRKVAFLGAKYLPVTAVHHLILIFVK